MRWWRYCGSTQMVESPPEEYQVQKTLHAILQTSPSAIIIINELSHIIEWSYRSEQMFGYMRDDVIGASLIDVIMPKQHKKGHLQGVQRYMKTKQSNLIGKDPVIVSAVHKDGHVFPISLSLSESLNNSNEILFVAFIQDISEKKRLRVEFDLLDRTYRSLRTFLDHAPAAIGIFSIDNWSCTFFNKAFERILKRIDAGADPKNALRVPESLNLGGQLYRVAETGYSYSVQDCYLIPFKSFYDVQITRIPLDNQFFVMLFLTDVTERVRVVTQAMIKPEYLSCRSTSFDG